MGALHRKRIADWLLTAPTNQDIEVSGWVRTKRGNKEIAFIALSDGSTINNLKLQKHCKIVTF
jgi:asparaginyl-tRNA synthetase